MQKALPLDSACEDLEVILSGCVGASVSCDQCVPSCDHLPSHDHVTIM